jgi:copper chaperone CopZ
LLWTEKTLTTEDMGSASEAETIKEKIKTVNTLQTVEIFMSFLLNFILEIT